MERCRICCHAEAWSSDLNGIYAEVRTYKKAEGREHYKEKVRQCLQQLEKAGLTRSIRTGVWAVA